MANSKATPQLGALTLVLLVRNYRSQMIALLARNGVAVRPNASEQNIANLMANLLKVSKSFAKDLSDFISNPAVAQVIGNGIASVSQTAQYFKASGGGYMNFTDYFSDNTPETTDPVLASTTTPPANTTSSTPAKTGFWDNINLSDILSNGIKAFGTYNTNQANVEIANARALVEQAKADAIKAGKEIYIDPTTGEKINVKDDSKDAGMSTTTIVVLSLVGVAVLGTVIYFIARPKNV
jgi:hypothetical protein